MLNDQQRYTALWYVFAVLIGISLHILLTISYGSAKVRFGISDVLIVPIFVFAIVRWRQINFKPLLWRLQHAWIWLLVLSLWVIISTINGYYQIGAFSSWAFVNKMVGWFVLLSYLFIAAWITSFLDIKISEAVIKAFLAGAWLICSYVLLEYAIDIYLYAQGMGASINYRPSGLAQNPNAFSITIAAAIALQASIISRTDIIPQSVARIGIGIGLATVLVVFSRSAILGLIISLATLVLFRKFLIKDLMASLSICLLLLAIIMYVVPVLLPGVIGCDSCRMDAEVNENGADYKNAYTLNNNYMVRRANKLTNTNVSSNADRITSMKAAINAWKDMPVVGIGIGTYYHQNRGKEGIAYTIHNSGLWILTEMGLVGFVLFSLFIFYVLRSILGGPIRTAPPVQTGVFAVMLVYIGASVGTEVMYQRTLWLLMGLAMAKNYMLSSEANT